MLKKLISRCFKINIILHPQYKPEIEQRVVRLLYLHGTPKSVMEEAETVLKDNQVVGMIVEEPSRHLYED